MVNAAVGISLRSLTCIEKDHVLIRGDLLERLSLAAYNVGPGNVTPQGMKAYIPETQEYVAKVMGHYSSYRNGMASLSNITINKR